MGRNGIETAIRFGLLTVLIGTAAYSPRPEPTSAQEVERSVTGAEKSPDVLPADPKEFIPVEVTLLMRNYYLKKWRASLPEDSEVTIIDFGDSRHSGPVLPKEGLKLRQLPTVHSKAANYVKWLRWGQEVNFRNLITIFNPNTGFEESWIVVDERGQPGARWYCGPGWPRGHGRCFAAARIGDEKFINLEAIMPPPAEDVTFHKWPH